jgi:hypothetical protein
MSIQRKRTPSLTRGTMLLISLLPAYAHCTGVLINEVLADPPPGLSGDANGDGLRHTYEDEFVELIHTGSDTISLAQWKIGDDDTSAESFFTFPAGTSLAPGQLLVLFGGGSPTLPSITAYIDDGRIGNGLSNGGDTILLLDALGDTVDIVRVATWPDDQSLARSADGSFTPHSTIVPTSFSPGQPHSPLLLDSTASHAQPTTINTTDAKDDQPTIPTADSTHSTDIFIRQILADPPDGIAGDSNGDGQRHTYEDEFVELVYTGTDTLSLDGWRIGDDDISTGSYFTFPTNTKLVPKAHLVLFGGSQPAPASFLAFGAGGRIGNGLSNSGDTILLLNAQGQVVDSAVGRSWPANQSVVRTSAHTDFIPHTALYDSPYSLPTASEENDSLSPPTKAEENERSLPDSSGHTRDDSTRAARPSNLQLAISEILADPPNDTNGDGQYSAYADEFIELFNGGDSVDLSGWYLSDDDTPLEKKFIFPAGSILRAGQYLVLFGGGQKPANDQILAFVDDGRIGDGLANTGDRILLHQSNGDTILNVFYTHADIDQSLHFDSGHAIPHGRLPASAPYSPGENRPFY